MSKKPKRILENVQKGYAEVYWSNYDQMGFVREEPYISWTDFDKDVIHEVNRWEAWLYSNAWWGINGYDNVGRQTGYRTREEALEFLDKYVMEHYYSVDEMEARREQGNR